MDFHADLTAAASAPADEPQADAAQSSYGKFLLDPVGTTLDTSLKRNDSWDVTAGRLKELGVNPEDAHRDTKKYFDLNDAKKEVGSKGVTVSQSFRKSFMGFSDLTSLNSLPDIPSGASVLGAKLFGGRVVGTKEYADAVTKFQAGTHTKDDLATIAQYERHNEIDAAVKKQANYGERLVLDIGGIAKIAQEGMAGGQVLGAGARLAGIGRAGVTAAAAGVAPAVPAAATTAAGLATVATTKLLQTAAMPSMYVPVAQQINQRAGRDPNSWKGFPTAFGYGYANTLVMGQFQKGLQGNVLADAAQKGLLGYAELQGVDLAAGVADQFLSKSYQIHADDDRFGTLGSWLRAYRSGDRDKAADVLRDASLGVLSFGAFAAMHGREQVADDLTKSYMGTVTALRNAGKSKREAAATVAELHDKLEAGLSENPWLDRTQAAKYLEPAVTKETEGYAKKLVEVFEPKPPESKGIADVPAANGTPVDPTAPAAVGGAGPEQPQAGPQPAPPEQPPPAIRPAVGAQPPAKPTDAPPTPLAPAPEAAVQPAPTQAASPAAPSIVPVSHKKDGTPVYDQKDIPQDIHNAAAEIGEKAYDASKAKGRSEARSYNDGQREYLATVATMIGERQKAATVATPSEAPSVPATLPESPQGNTPTTPPETQPAQSPVANRPSLREGLARLKALQEGRTPGVATVATPAETLPPTSPISPKEIASEPGQPVPHPDQIVNLARAALHENTNGLSPEKRAEYGASFEKSIGAMSPGARARVNENVKRVAFYGTPHEAALANAKEWVLNPDITDGLRTTWTNRLKELEDHSGRGVGAFNLTSGTLHLDGNAPWERGAGYDFGDAQGILRREAIYRHEFGHALDGTGFEHSRPGGKGWYLVHVRTFGPNARKKAGYVHLTDYATEYASESLAEFNRIVGDESIPTAQIARDFPEPTAYFKREGWWPAERGPAEPPLAPTKATEVFTERVGPPEEHVDVSGPKVERKAEPAPISAPELNRRPNADREFVTAERDRAPKEAHDLYDSALHNMVREKADARGAAAPGQLHPSEGHARRADTVAQLESVRAEAVKRNLPGVEHIDRSIAALKAVAEPAGKYGPVHIDRTEEMSREPVATVAAPKAGARKLTDPAKEGLSNLQSTNRFAPPAPPPPKVGARKRTAEPAPTPEEAARDAANAERLKAPDPRTLDAEALDVGKVSRADLSSIHGVVEFLQNSGKLSPTELKYLTGRVRGETTAEIAKILGVSKQAVEQLSDKGLKKVGFDSFDDIMLGIKGRGRVFEHINADATRNAEGAKTSTSATDLFHRSVGSAEGELKLPFRTTILDALFGKAGIGQRSLIDRVKSLFFGDLPDIVRIVRQQEMEGPIAQYAFDVRNTVKDFRAALIESGVRYEQLDKATLRQMDQVLRSDKAARVGIHPKVLEALDNMRAQVDKLSEALISVGAIDGPLVATVTGNMGVYLNRQFEVFTNPTHFRDVERPIVNRFKAYLKDQLTTSRGVAPTDEEVAAITNSLLVDGTAAENPIAFLRKSKLGSKDLSILQKRGEIVPELRALWGEIEDPLINYANSVAKMAQLLAHHQFLNRVAIEGLGKFLFKSTDLEAFQKEHPNSAAVKIAEKDSLVMGALADLYTTPEIKAAFETQFARPDYSAGMQWYMKALAMAKFSKTILSHTGQIRNFLSNVGIIAANGHWRIDKLPQAFHDIVSDTPKARDYWRKLIGMNVVGQELSYQDFQKTIQDAFGDRKPNPLTTGVPLIDGVMNRMWKVGELAAKTYMYGDAVWKVYAFESEARRYESAGYSRGQAELKAADIVRKTMPTYSALPEIIQKLRRLPIVAPFISFQAEILRNTKNTIALAREELRDPATRHIGAQRLAGLLGSVALPAALAAATRAMFGVSQDEEDAMRRGVPDYEKQSRFVFVGRKDGRPEYIDISKTDPHSYISDGVLAAMRGETVEKGVKDAMGEWAKPFVQEELLLRPIFDIARNQKEPGGQVYNPSDTTLNQIKGVATVATQPFVPAGVSPLRRLAMAATATAEQKSGTTYDTADTVKENISGQRVESVDFALALANKARGFKAQEAQSAKLTQDMIHARGAVSPDELKDARERTVAGRQAALDEMRKDVEAAQKFGSPPMTKGQIARVLMESGVSVQDIGALFTGRQMPYLPAVQGTTQERVRAGAVRKLAGSSPSSP